MGRGAGFLVAQGVIWVVYGFVTSSLPGGKSDYESNAVQFLDPAFGKLTDTEVESTGAKPSAMSVSSRPGTLSTEGDALNTETIVWEKFGGGNEPEMPRGWTTYTQCRLIPFMALALSAFLLNPALPTPLPPSMEKEVSSYMAESFRPTAVLMISTSIHAVNSA
ncbi:unnamed protein product [Arabidopsis thaliana]|uniref:(thale cress) hypothetical protein n=1 Tax=Arabidopsis thaliana TaxID=3702 RepID=A0A7G2DXN5_ARATH|nr:unnamed protein product [Arabidopsis thaliana]